MHWLALQAKSRESRENLRCAASLGKKRQTLSLPPTCTLLCEKGKFSLDSSFSKNAPYKQKIIFHLTSIGKMSKKDFFFPWTVGRWYGIFFFNFYPKYLSNVMQKCHNSPRCTLPVFEKQGIEAVFQRGFNPIHSLDMAYFFQFLP